MTSNTFIRVILDKKFDLNVIFEKGLRERLKKKKNKGFFFTYYNSTKRDLNFEILNSKKIKDKDHNHLSFFY